MRNGGGGPPPSNFAVSAAEMSVLVVRAFVKMREHLPATTTLAQRLAEVEKAEKTRIQRLKCFRAVRFGMFIRVWKRDNIKARKS